MAEKQSTFTMKLESKLSPIAGKLAGNRVLSSISDGFLLIFPVIMIGAISSLITGLDFGNYKEWLSSSVVGTMLMAINNATMSSMALYVVVSTAYSFTIKEFSAKESLISGAIALMSFMIITPVTVTEAGTNVIETALFGPKGMIVALIVALISSSIYCLGLRKKWTLKMPAGVPDSVNKSFAALIPVVGIATLFFVIAVLCKMTSYGSLGGLIIGILQAPLSHLSSSIFSMMLIVLVGNSLWWLGIHSFGVVFPFMMALFLPGTLENMEAYAQGLPPVHSLSFGLWALCLLGGSGTTIGLALLMAFTSKSQRYKKLGRIAIVPALFNINEPIIFGVPIVMNPVMLIPFILTPQVALMTGYLFISNHIIPFAGATYPVTVPPIVHGFLQGGFLAALLEVGLIIISTCIYFPFFKIMDRKAKREEEAAVQETAEKAV